MQKMRRPDGGDQFSPGVGVQEIALMPDGAGVLGRMTMVNRMDFKSTTQKRRDAFVADPAARAG